MPSPTHYDAIVVGGGFGGIYTTYKLREQGYNVHAFEKGSNLGGIWYWNKYPGARVDSDVPVYQLWIKEVYKDWNFKERFPGWKELGEYFAHVEKKINISKNYTFNTFISSCKFDKDTGLWTVTGTGEGAGTYTCKHLVVCSGFAAKKFIPNFKGLDKYKGIMHHTSEWPGDEVDFKNKKVAVIGTGASGVQVIQEIGPVVKELTVFQRTPNLAIPMVQKKVTAEEQEARKNQYPEIFKQTSLDDSFTAGFEFGFDPRSALEVTDEEREAHFQKCWDEGGFHFWVATFHDVWTNEEADKYQYEFWRKNVVKRLTRPEMIEKLAPSKQPNPFVAKRPCLEQRYYEVYNQPNVDIFDLHEEKIIEFNETGILTSRGQMDFDIIVLATGFDAVTGGLTQMDIRGIHGESLGERWQSGLKTFLGVSANDFPNFYFMYGPQGPTAFSNGPTCAQLQAKFIIDLIRYTDSNNLKYVEPDAEAEKAWGEHVNKVQSMTMVDKAKTATWYIGTNIEGKKREALCYLGGVPEYNRRLLKEAGSNFEHFIKVPVA